VRLRRAPGGRFGYSNFGAGLLGHVRARRAGLAYEELVAERVLRPLGMGDRRRASAARSRGPMSRGRARAPACASGWGG
jgi:CubicO group peptidase (beta-lactamase class C family)